MPLSTTAAHNVVIKINRCNGEKRDEENQEEAFIFSISLAPLTLHSFDRLVEQAGRGNNYAFISNSVADATRIANDR
jgi:hypothetical protein